MISVRVDVINALNPPVTPTRWERRSRNVTSRVTHGSLSANHGRCRVTGSSQPSFPSSTSIARIAEENALLVEPISNIVRVVTGSVRPTCRTPYPRSRMIESPRTTAIATPGTRQRRSDCSTYPSKPASGSACAAREGAPSVARRMTADSRFDRICRSPDLDRTPRCSADDATKDPFEVSAENRRPRLPVVPPLCETGSEPCQILECGQAGRVPVRRLGDRISRVAPGPLGIEVEPEPDVLRADHPGDMVDVPDEVHDGGRPAAHESRERAHPDDAAGPGAGANLIIGEIERVGMDCRGIHVTEYDRMLRPLHYVERAPPSRVGEVDQEARAVELGDGAPTEPGQREVARFVAAIGHQIAPAARELGDAEPRRAEFSCQREIPVHPLKAVTVCDYGDSAPERRGAQVSRPLRHDRRGGETLHRPAELEQSPHRLGEMLGLDYRHEHRRDTSGSCGGQRRAHARGAASRCSQWRAPDHNRGRERVRFRGTLTGAANHQCGTRGPGGGDEGPAADLRVAHAPQTSRHTLSQFPPITRPMSSVEYPRSISLETMVASPVKSERPTG